MGKKDHDREEITKLIARFDKWSTEKLLHHITLTLTDPAERAIKEILNQRGIQQ